MAVREVTEHSDGSAPNPGGSVDIYRERAHLLAYLASLNASGLVHGADPDAPEWPVLFVETARGQMSWHIAPADVELFGHVSQYDDKTRSWLTTWDGHTTEEKYARLAAHTADVAEAVR